MAESILPVCLLLPNSVENTGNWQEAMGKKQHQEQTAQSRKPSVVKAKWRWPFPEFRWKVGGVHQPNVREERESPGRRVQCLQGKAWFLLTNCWLFYLGRVTLPPLSSFFWAMERRQKQSTQSCQDQVQLYMWPELTFNSAPCGRLCDAPLSRWGLGALTQKIAKQSGGRLKTLNVLPRLTRLEVWSGNLNPGLRCILVFLKP